MYFDVLRYFDHHKYWFMYTFVFRGDTLKGIIVQKILICYLKSNQGFQTRKKYEKLWISTHGFLLNIFGKVGAMCYLYSDIIKRC